MDNFRKLGEKYNVTKLMNDKFPGQTFEHIYDDIFSPFRLYDPLKVLEIGIQEGGSLRVWRDFFLHAQIIGIDIDKKYLYQEERISTYLIDQSDEENLNKLITQYNGFDIVIDDGGHFSDQQIITLKNLLPFTKYLYCIEDLDTSYPELYPTHSRIGEDTIMTWLKTIADWAVLEKHKIERIDFRKRFVSIHKKN